MVTSSAPGTTGHRFLFAMFQGGGNIPLILPIAARLVDGGHDVRIIAGPGVRASRLPVSERFRERIAETGATLIPFQEPGVHPFDEAPPPRGLARGWIPEQLALATGNAPPWRWSTAWATNVTAELDRASADVVVADFVLPGALAAAEAAAVPSAALVHNFYLFRPAPGLPAPYFGFMPNRSPVGFVRDALLNRAIEQVYRCDALPFLNRARRQLGLPTLHSPFTQYDRASRVLILGSVALDFPARRLPPNVRYVGTPFDDANARSWDSPWQGDDPRPLVVVSLSTLSQGQGPVMHRILAAVAALPVRALVTLGASLVPTEFRPAPNTVLQIFVPHGAVLPQASAMVTQCGLGGMTKALAHGVPLVCIPLVGDQPDNAARAVARGAGIRLKRDASPEQIRMAIQRVLAERQFREGAHRLATLLAEEGDGAERGAQELLTLSR